MIDLRLIEAEALQPLDDPRPLWRRVVFALGTGLVVVSIVGVGIARGWW